MTEAVLLHCLTWWTNLLLQNTTRSNKCTLSSKQINVDNTIEPHVRFSPCLHTKSYSKLFPSGPLLKEVFFLNPLSPNIYIQILQTDLHTFPYWISWENLFKDQSISFSFSQLLFLLCIDIDRRKIMLVSQSKRKSLYSFVPWTSTILNLMVQTQDFSSKRFCQVHKPNGARKNK